MTICFVYHGDYISSVFIPIVVCITIHWQYLGILVFQTRGLAVASQCSLRPRGNFILKVREGCSSHPGG